MGTLVYHKVVEEVQPYKQLVRVIYWATTVTGTMQTEPTLCYTYLS